jgi:hypothetical protein
VWKALNVPREQWGGLDITWSDAWYCINWNLCVSMVLF